MWNFYDFPSLLPLALFLAVAGNEFKMYLLKENLCKELNDANLDDKTRCGSYKLIFITDISHFHLFQCKIV